MASSSARLSRALPWLLTLPSVVCAAGDALGAGLAAGDALQLADELAAAGRHHEAATHYQTLLDDPPAQWDGWMQAQLRLRLAGSQLAQGDFATARFTLQAMQRAPSELQEAARALRLRIGEIESEAAHAMAAGLAALRADPDSVWGYRDLARALALQGRSTQAWSALRQQLGLPDADMALAMVEATETIGQTAAAIELALDWLEQRPQDHVLRAAVLRLSVDHAVLPRMLEIHERHLPSLPDPALARSMLARRLAHEEWLEEALAQYRLLLDDRVFGLDSHLAMAALHDRLQQPDQAMQMLRQAIERWPDHGPALPGRRSADRSPYTALLGHACHQQRLAQLERDWPALDGPDGALIRRHLAQARRQAVCATDHATLADGK